jgi:hypothetical protein
MNCRTDFIAALAGLVERALAHDAQAAPQLNCIHCPDDTLKAGDVRLCACDRISK